MQERQQPHKGDHPCLNLLPLGTLDCEVPRLYRCGFQRSEKKTCGHRKCVNCPVHIDSTRRLLSSTPLGKKCKTQTIRAEQNYRPTTRRNLFAETAAKEADCNAQKRPAGCYFHYFCAQAAPGLTLTLEFLHAIMQIEHHKCQVLLDADFSSHYRPQQLKMKNCPSHLHLSKNLSKAQPAKRGKILPLAFSRQRH